ncbi:MAG: tetratricopeptide repeat protein, partial [Nannocystaceae bacterium]|nr:tetratricopeptide repeat protein [Nannocystaceae bacterium]
DARRCLERAHAQRVAQLEALREAAERDPSQTAAALAGLASATACDEAASWSDAFAQALARAQALRVAGDLVRALDEQAHADAVLGEASAPRERAALAGERARVLGELGDAGRIDAAIAWFVAAERAADADAAARAAAMTTSWVLEQHADLDLARTWLARAHSSSQRAGATPQLRAHVAIAEAALAWRERRADDATGAARNAVTLARSAGDVELEALAASHLGVTLARQGRIAESITVFEAQRAALESRVGPTHPRMVAVLLNLGASLTTAGRHDEALSSFARARDLIEQRRGPDAPELARVEHNLAATELFRENPQRAAYHAARAVALSEGGNVPLHIGALHHLGMALVATDRAAEAEAIAWRGAAIVDQSYGAEHRFAADFLELAGDAAIARGDTQRGAALHQRAFALAQVLQPDPMRLAALGTKVAVDRIAAGDDDGGDALLAAWLGRLEAGNPRLARAALRALAEAWLTRGQPCAAAIYADRIVGGADPASAISLRARAHERCGVAPAYARALQQRASEPSGR